MEKIVSNVWMVEETTNLSKMVIEKGGRLEAPEDKFLVVTVDGVTVDPQEGVYEGNIILNLADQIEHQFNRIAGNTVCKYKTGLYIKDGKYDESYSVPAAVIGGCYGDGECSDIRMRSESRDVNGIIVDDGEYQIKRLHVDFTSDGDDSVGIGAAVLVMGDGKVKILDADIRTNGVSRSALAVLDHGEAELYHCRLHAEGPDRTEEEVKKAEEEGRPGAPPWQIGLRGSCRTTSMDDSATVKYYDCHVSARNWGCLSVDDDSPRTHIYAKDSVFEVIGDNGYGCFAISCDVPEDYQEKDEYGSYHIFDRCKFRVPTYLMYLSLGKAGAEYINGTEVESKRWGIFVFRSSGGLLKIGNGTKFHTGKAALVFKGSAVRTEIDSAVIEADNGTILQMMDNDDPGHMSDKFEVPFGDDKKDPDRDLTTAQPKEDVFVNVSNTELTGNFFNATTNRVADRLPRPEEVTEVPPNFVRVRGIRGKDLQGAKNLDLKLVNASVTGLITSAAGRYRDGITVIDNTNCEEMSNIICQAAVPVNNGVILSLDKDSRWTVTGTSYITRLEMAEGAVIEGKEGRSLKMYVDDAEVPVKPGVYTGAICFVVDEMI